MLKVSKKLQVYQVRSVVFRLLKLLSSILKHQYFCCFFCPGKEAHAAACPWVAKNALDAAIQCYNNISMLRQQMRPGCLVHGIIIDGGVKPNIIPHRSEIEYYIRGPTCKDRDELFELVTSCAKAAAQATGNYIFCCQIVARNECTLKAMLLDMVHVSLTLHGTRAILWDRNSYLGDGNHEQQCTVHMADKANIIIKICPVCFFSTNCEKA